MSYTNNDDRTPTGPHKRRYRQRLVGAQDFRQYRYADSNFPAGHR